MVEGICYGRRNLLLVSISLEGKGEKKKKGLV